jgi:23S rRNA (adenine2503-C2)-methyltransferase
MLKHIKTRNFSNGFVSMLKLNDGKPIETTATCLPFETELRGIKENKGKDSNIITELKDTRFDYWNEKFMIGVSTQSGCPIKCKFCAVNKVTEQYGWRNLTSEEMFGQVKFAIDKVKNDCSYDIDKNKPKLFRVLFTRMGEPSLNISNVIKAIRLIVDKYPFARVQVSTIGLNASRKLIEELMRLEYSYKKNFIEYQFSVHSTDNGYRRWLQCENVLNNEEVNDICGNIMSIIPKRAWKVTLNFTLSEHTPFNTSKLLEQFDPNNVFIKLSPINENVVSKENNLKTLFEYQNND